MNARSLVPQARPPVSRPRSGPRTGRGRFAPGASGNPAGRPAKSVEEGYLEAFRQAVTPEVFGKAAAALAEKAKSGDVRAFQALAGYALSTRTAANIEWEARLERLEGLKDDKGV
jgi:hypothetical protein